jgi:hypothetical protein
MMVRPTTTHYSLRNNQLHGRRIGTNILYCYQSLIGRQLFQEGDTSILPIEPTLCGWSTSEEEVGSNAWKSESSIIIPSLPARSVHSFTTPQEQFISWSSHKELTIDSWSDIEAANIVSNIACSNTSSSLKAILSSQVEIIQSMFYWLMAYLTSHLQFYCHQNIVESKSSMREPRLRRIVIALSLPTPYEHQNRIHIHTYLGKSELINSMVDRPDLDDRTTGDTRLT